MDKSRIFKIIDEAEAEIATLDKALDSGSDEQANWTLLILSGIIQDLRRLAEEESMPTGMDKQKLSKTFQTALSALGEGRDSIRQGEYRLTHSDSVLLSLALNDMRELINAIPEMPS